jgi:hypothetical protein
LNEIIYGPEPDPLITFTPAGHVQLYAEPGQDVPVNVTVALLPRHIGSGETVKVAIGLGRSVSIRFIGKEEHPLKVEVIVNVTV